MSIPNELPSGQDMAEEAARLGAEARSRASEMASDVTREAEAAVEGAGRQLDRMEGQQGGAQLNERLNQGIRAASQQMGSLAQQMRERAPQGQGGEMAHVAAGVLDRGASYLEGADAERLRGDLEGMIRRNPIGALAIGVGLGIVIGRALKR